jgi:pimeloyl-ACP methyl ester carboxylesterase
VVEFGGAGPGILLLHGLMGRATTWWGTARWLSGHGRVVGVDARAHGRNPHRKHCDTEQFAADAADRIRDLRLGPSVVIGHSMGGLHAIALAAGYPDLVRGIVVVDMAPDNRGRTAEVWRPYLESWPAFQSLAHVRDFFGPAGDYFVECVEEHEDGYRLIGDLHEMFEIAQEWGRRDYWDLVAGVRCPMLVIEAGESPMPPGQLAEMARRAGGDARHVRIHGAGHIVHEDAPLEFRYVVETFLDQFT